MHGKKKKHEVEFQKTDQSIECIKMILEKNVMVN